MPDEEGGAREIIRYLLAAGLGENVAVARAMASFGAILLCGAATAICGPIGFVGLVVPHLCRSLVGVDNRWLLPFSALGGACLLLAASAPFLTLVALAIKLDSRGPVLYRGARVGRGGQSFEMLKFRSMVTASNGPSSTAQDDPRITRVGRFLRRTSLDELPQLWNVLKGDMSLVGPRPLLIKYLPLYTAEQMRRHEVRPGITGLAQIEGRNQLDWPERFRLDTWYVDNYSLAVDVKCLLRTISKVVRREGIHEQGHVTAREFTGDT